MDFTGTPPGTPPGLPIPPSPGHPQPLPLPGNTPLPQPTPPSDAGGDDPYPTPPLPSDTPGIPAGNWHDSLNVSDKSIFQEFRTEQDFVNEYLKLKEAATLPTPTTPAVAPVVNPNAVPPTPAGYQWNLGQGKALDTMNDKHFRQIAHSKGLTQAQFEAMQPFAGGGAGIGTRDGTEDMAAGFKAVQDSNRVAETLQTEWKHDYNQNMERAGTAMRRMWGENFISVAEEKGLLFDVEFIKQMAIHGKTLDEDVLRQAHSSQTLDIEKEIAKRQGNPDYFNDQSPNCQTLRDEVNQLLVQKHQLYGR